MQTVEVIHPVTLGAPQELVNDQLLCEVYGEIVLIHTAHATTICKRSAGKMKQQALTWLYRTGAENSSFLAGKITERGGRFKFITRDQAIELLGTWIFQELQLSIR